MSSVGVSVPRRQPAGTVRAGPSQSRRSRRTTITLEDDINGTADYEIDLNAKNARRFRTQMAPFIDHARKAGRRQRRPARPAGVPPSFRTADPLGSSLGKDQLIVSKIQDLFT